MIEAANGEASPQEPTKLEDLYGYGQRGYWHQMPELCVLLDYEATLLDIGESGVAKFGYSPDELFGESLFRYIHPMIHPRIAGIVADLKIGDTAYLDVPTLDVNGKWRKVSYSMTRVGYDRLLGIGRELDHVTHESSELRDLVRLAEITNDVLSVVDSQGMVRYVNRAAERHYGAHAVVGSFFGDWFDTDDDGFKRMMRVVATGGKRFEGRVGGYRSTGDYCHMSLITVFDEESELWYSVIRDVTDAVQSERELARLNADLRRQATTDDLTGSANRAAFTECVSEALDTGTQFCLMLLDMDDFKSVNDTYGHNAGDMFLREVARRMHNAVRLCDLVARIGGDEFVVYLPDISYSEAEEIARRLVASVNKPIDVGEATVSRSCSLGASVWSKGQSLNEVLTAADKAVYEAKSSGRNRFILPEGF